MGNKRRSYDAEFKMELVLMVLSGRELKDVAAEHDIHRSLLSRWKKEFLNGGQKALVHKNKKKNNTKEKKLKKELERMQRIIGEQRAQIDILKKKPWQD